MGQYTMIIPSKDLVVLRQGPGAGGMAAHFEEMLVRILEILDGSAVAP